MQQQKPQQPQLTKPKAIDRKEWTRLRKLHHFEFAARENGHKLIAGIDEAGRGPLAGPVVAAACIIPEGNFVVGVNDSKQLTAKQRQVIFDRVINDASIHYGIGVVSHEEIDRINIFQASLQAMLLAIAELAVIPEYLLVDGVKLPHPTIPTQKIVKGDQKSHSIATASIIAKVTRDRLMTEFDKQWPLYGFAQHKGYGTPEHLSALATHGPCPIHRRSFAPCNITS